MTMRPTWLKDREIRRLWAAILGGKMLGLVGVLGAMALLTHFLGSGGVPSPARAPSDAIEPAGDSDDARVGTTT